MRERWPESDLDVYVHKDVREEICRWVLAQGYTFKPSRHQKENFELAIKEVKPEPLHQDDRYAWIAVDSVFTFVKPDDTHPKGELQVQIIVSKGNPMEVILKFHTCTCSALPSLYPLAHVYCSRRHERYSMGQRIYTLPSRYT